MSYENQSVHLVTTLLWVLIAGLSPTPFPTVSKKVKILGVKKQLCIRNWGEIAYIWRQDILANVVIMI